MDDINKIGNTSEVTKLVALDQSKIINLKDENSKQKASSQPEAGEKETQIEEKRDIQIDKLISIANRFVNRFSTKITFTYDPELQMPMILVTEKETGRVIRQIPPEQMVSLMKKMEEIAGIIYNGRA